MTKPTISVLMAIYDEPIEWLKSSITSIQNQSYDNYEFIIINDNPKRGLNKIIIDDFMKSDSRIKLITNSVNLGLTKSLNIGLNISKGEYIARMDADDISLPYRLEKQVAFLKNNDNVVLCGGLVQYFGKRKGIGYKQFAKGEIDLNAELIIGNPIAHSTAMLRKEILIKKNILYDEKIKYSQDYKLWCTLADFGGITVIPHVIVKYRISDTQISSKKKTEQEKFECIIRTDYIMKHVRLSNLSTSNKKEIRLAIKNGKYNRLYLEKIYYWICMSSFKPISLEAFIDFFFIIRLRSIRIKLILKYILKIFKIKEVPNC